MLSGTIPDRELQGFNSYNTITIQNSLAHSIGTNETIVYNALVSKYIYYRNRNKLTEDGFFMGSENDLRESTTLCGKPLTRIMKNIESKGLIRQELRGMPAKKFVYIVQDDKLLMSLMTEGANTANVLYCETTEARFWGDNERKPSDVKKNEGFLSLFSEHHKLYINRPLAHSIGLEPTVAWAVIVTKYFQCQRYGSLREDGSFYITEADFEEMCGYKRRRQKAAIDELIAIGFIQTTVAGVPARRYFRITVSSEKLNAAVLSGMETSKNVYLMTSDAAERSIRKKELAENNRPATAAEIDEYIVSQMGQNEQEIQFVQNSGTSSYQTEKQACTNGSIKFVQNGGTRMDKSTEHTLNLNIYNHDISQSVSRGQQDTESTESETHDGLTDETNMKNDIFSFSSAKEILSERIGYSWYESHFKNHDNEKTNIGSLKQVDFVIAVMLDALSRAHSKGYIQLSKNGRTVTYGDLYTHFLEQLDRRHLELFFEKYDPKKIKNIRAYTLTSIYNTIDEADMLELDRTSEEETSSFSIDLWYDMAKSYDPEKISFKEEGDKYD